MAIMGSIHVFVLLSLLATFAQVDGHVCPPCVSAAIKCEGITSSSCITNNQVLIPCGGYCGCCPVCARKIKKGERCGGLQLLLGAFQEAGCERGTMCKKRLTKAISFVIEIYRLIVPLMVILWLEVN